MSTLNERIKELRTTHDFTLFELAQKLGVRDATLQRYESGKIKNVPYDIIIKLAAIFDCSPSYLMGWVEAPSAVIKNVDDILPICTQKIPLLGTIAAGQPILADERLECYVDCGAEIHADFALRVRGDSMVNAFIRDGDIVFIRKQESVEQGEIAAVIIGDEVTLKRFHQYGDVVVLRAENASFKDMSFSLTENDDVRILGKAIAFQSDAR